MKLFITGSSGFVGEKVVAGCIALGHEVLAVDMTVAPNSFSVEADIRSKDIASLIPENADAIIHLAGLTRDADCRNRANDCFDVNVMATLNLIDAAAAKGVKQFIFASSEWVYDSFKGKEYSTEETVIDVTKLDSEYALSKLVSEQNLRQKYNHGFCDVTILRFGIIYGPRKSNWSAVESLFNKVRNGEPISVGSLKTGRCFIHVSDIVSGIIKAISLKGFNIINLQGQRLITLQEIIETSQRILNKQSSVEEKTPANVSIRPIMNKKSKELLGWVPEVGLEEGLKTLL